MKKWLFLVVLALSTLANAQNPAPATKINYRKDVPKSVLRLMPKSAQSLFWGTFQDGKNAAPKAIHLFAIAPKIQFSQKEPKKMGYHLTLDIFEQKPAQWKRFNRVPVGYRASIWGPILVRANFYWVDPNRQIPLLNVECFTKDGYYSDTPVGDALFLSFAKGWKRKAILQSFYFGASPPTDTSDYSFGRTVRGNLEIVRDDGSMNAGNDANGNDLRAILVFRWKQRRFVAIPETIPMLGPYEGNKQWKP